jgi:NitT/TauT family transport system permease protein
MTTTTHWRDGRPTAAAVELPDGRAARPAATGDRDVRTAVRSSRRRPPMRLVAPAVVFALVIAVWYLFAEVLMSPHRRFLVPPPHEVWQLSFANGDNRGEILGALWVTTKVALTGLVIATVLGVAIAVAMSLADWVEASIYPYAILIQTIPILAIVPLLGLLFGFGFRSRVIVCVMIALFPIITNTLFGLKSADRSMHDLFSLARVSRATRLWKLQLPAALPAMFTGMRIAAGASVIGAVVGDFFFQRGDAGLGVQLRVYSTQLLTPQLYGVVVVCALLGVAIFLAFGLLARWTTGKWHKPVTR